MQKIFIILALSFLISVTVRAQKPEVFNNSGTAISGYDAVAYFSDGKHMEGKTEFSHHWKSANWHFASAKNLEAFKKDPEKYAPQYGGYCAYGMAQGYKAPTDPAAWSIVNGKLYLNYNKDVQKLWNENQAKSIERSDKNWPGIKNK
ncbi:MAG: YHS domain-containing protein [Chitinophagaceae bacterium]|nr:YHS domain-containing protein [Chitinophagaceae bacterium]